MEITMVNGLEKDYNLTDEQIDKVMNGGQLNAVFEFHFNKTFFDNVKRRLIREVWNRTTKKRNFSRKIRFKIFMGNCCDVKDLVNTRTRRTEYFQDGYASYVEEIESLSRTKMEMSILVTYKIGGNKNGRK